MPDAATRLTTALAGRYRIERALGAGGMATVFLARDLKHDRDVALKVLRPELAAVLGAERFLQEIRISAKLDHPHILTLIDSGESEGFVWYVLPYVRGESLRQKLTREKQLSIEEAVRIATQVASALDYAHRQGVIHRDIKPENILLHEGEAVVADFGIALAVREAGGQRFTESGLSLGTPQYMSPEQATGGRELDARADVYSLAAVVYETLAGEPPHTGPTVQVVIAKLLTERPTRIRTVRDTVPEGIDTAVAKALAKVPADRFAGAAEFAAALAGPGAGPTAGQRRRRVALAASIAGAVALTGIAALWHPWRRPAKAAAPVADVASVAVLPFDNLTGNPGDRYLSDGMTEEVIGQLARVQGLKVISRTSTEALKGAHLTLRQIADTLGVRHILEGSVRHEGHRIRVAVDLIDARTDAHVWASSFDRALTGVFAVQEEIARQVADSLVSTVGVRPTIGRVARTEHPGAYAAYLRGRYLMYRRTREALRGALELFQQAIAQDSAFAPPTRASPPFIYFGASTTMAASTPTKPTAARWRWPTGRSSSTQIWPRPTQPVALPWCAPGRQRRRSRPISSERSSFSPTRLTCTSGMRRSCRGKAATTGRSPRWRGPQRWTRWLRGFASASRSPPWLRGITMWVRGRRNGQRRSNPASCWRASIWR